MLGVLVGVPFPNPWLKAMSLAFVVPCLWKIGVGRGEADGWVLPAIAVGLVCLKLFALEVVAIMAVPIAPAAGLLAYYLPARRREIGFGAVTTMIVALGLLTFGGRLEVLIGGVAGGARRRGGRRSSETATAAADSVARPGGVAGGPGVALRRGFAVAWLLAQAAGRAGDPCEDEPFVHYGLDAMWASLAVGVPTINGYTGYYPSAWYGFLLADSEVGLPLKVLLERWDADHGLRAEDVQRIGDDLPRPNARKQEAPIDSQASN